LDDNISFSTPDGGIHLWCKLNRPVDDQKLLEESIRKGIAFVPGSILGSEKGCQRFTYGRAETSLIHEGIYRFSEALKNIEK
jgi:GntR family transcriptional regulator of abcA and norABC